MYLFGLVPVEFLFRFIYETTRDALDGTSRVNPHNPGPSVTVAVVTNPGSTFFQHSCYHCTRYSNRVCRLKTLKPGLVCYRQVYTPYPDITIIETEDNKICSSFSVEPNVSPISQKILPSDTWVLLKVRQCRYDSAEIYSVTFFAHSLSKTRDYTGKTVVTFDLFSITK